MLDLIAALIATALNLTPTVEMPPEPAPVVIDLTEPTVPTTVPPTTTTTLPEPVCDWSGPRGGQPAECYVYPA